MAKHFLQTVEQIINLSDMSWVVTILFMWMENNKQQIYIKHIDRQSGYSMMYNLHLWLSTISTSKKLSFWSALVQKYFWRILQIILAFKLNGTANCSNTTQFNEECDSAVSLGWKTYIRSRTQGSHEPHIVLSHFRPPQLASALVHLAQQCRLFPLESRDPLTFLVHLLQ